MRPTIPILPFLLVSALAAQSNAVPGMDVLVYSVTDIAVYGRRGAAYPNGEAGFAIGHSYCNAGTVNVPWVSTGAGQIMLDTYPKVAFLLVRESDGRMVQITGKSFLKHSTAAFNFTSGPCAPCNASGGGFFFTGCSDTYSSGFNASQLTLGPTTEIDPWLGTWNSQGSYFDRGDPPVSGNFAIDRIKSLTATMVSAFGPVKNRLEVRESELVIAGTFYGQVQAVIQGEPVANRHNNVQHRPMSFAWNGSSWSASVSGSASTGSVLTRWTNATTDLGGNGNDDGRFLVAVKVTGPVGGVWHYEYAVHNLDNARGGGSFRVPVAASAQVTAAGFRDIDTDPIDDWTFARNGTAITFTAPPSNPQDWNTIYNFWFDCTVGPSLGVVSIDEARSGPGLPTVSVNSQVPSGIPTALVTRVGTGCGLDLAASARPILNTTLSLTTSTIPPTTSVGMLLFGFSQAIPPIGLGPIGMPGCELHVLDGRGEAFVPASSSYAMPVTVPNDPTLTSLRVIVQSFTYGPPLTPLGLIASNGLVLVLGPS